MDKFKQYLQQQNWEVDEPSPKAWQGIQQKMEKQAVVKPAPPKKRALVVSMFKYAAAACIIGLAIVGGWYIFNKPTQPAVVLQEPYKKPIIEQPLLSPKVDTLQTIIQNSSKSLAKQETKKEVRKLASSASSFTPNNNVNVYKEQLQQMENNFTQVIYMQKAKINQTPLFGESAAYYKDFIDKLNQMEKDEKLIKKDILQLGLTPELMEQLINVYQQKLNVLKLLQTEIIKTNNRYKQNRSAADTLKTNFIEI